MSASPAAHVPQTHALFVGVSDYPWLEGTLSSSRHTLGLKTLSSPALSAYAVYEWFNTTAAELAAPLGSCELLLAPSRAEMRFRPELAAYDRTMSAKRPTLANFSAAAERWRTAASQHPDDIALFYFAGHGVQRSGSSQALLLEDFANPKITKLLAGAVEFTNVRSGMAVGESQPNMARTQLYFVDACRSTPKEVVGYAPPEATNIWDNSQNPVDDRDAPIFYAASPGRTAAGKPSRRSFFSNALIECLDGRAVVKDGTTWWVTTLALQAHLQSAVDEATAEHRIQQRVMFDKVTSPIRIRRLAAPPEVAVRIEVRPPADAGYSTLGIKNAFLKDVCSIGAPIAPHPYEKKLPAGVYTLSLQSSQRPTAELEEPMRAADPPTAHWPLTLI